MDSNKRPYQQVAQQLKQQLVEGYYRVGDRLPPERDIAAHFNVSRTIIREAIIMLELEHLVKVKMGSGTYVINLPQHLSPSEDILQNNIIFKNDDVGPFEMLQARQLLESGIAEFAAIQVTPKDIMKLRSALELERQELSHNVSKYNGDHKFHLYIAEATQNTVLVEMFHLSWNIREQSSMWRQLHSRINSEDYRKEWLIDHEKIIQAIQKKDPAAAKYAMWRHLENVKTKLFELSDTESPNFDGFLFNSSPVADIEKNNG